MQLGDFHLQLAMGLKRPVLLNIAACQLRQQDYHGAVATCGEVLQEDPQNAKALFRRGKARRTLGQSEAALRDLEAARAAAPGDAAVAKELATVRRDLQQERTASSQVFKGYFDKAKAAGDVLYDEPPPPVTPEASASVEAASFLQRHKLVAPLQGRRVLRTAAIVAVLAIATYWCWVAVSGAPPILS